MTEIETAASAGYVPGKHEAEALRYMNESEPSSDKPTRHLVAQQMSPDRFMAWEWSRNQRVWKPWNETIGYTRRTMVDALLPEIGWSNLSIMDERIDFKDYTDIGPGEFDHIVFCEDHLVLCPVGVPGGSDAWAVVCSDGDGVGRSLASGSFFARSTLAARFRSAALPVETPALGPNAVNLRVPPILVRHDAIARGMVPKTGWHVTGRPDLAARAIDRELAVNAAVAAEEERARKAGDWVPPPQQLYGEIAIRMQKEWAAQDRAAQAA